MPGNKFVSWFNLKQVKRRASVERGALRTSSKHLKVNQACRVDTPPWLMVVHNGSKYLELVLTVKVYFSWKFGNCIESINWLWHATGDCEQLKNISMRAASIKLPPAQFCVQIKNEVCIKGFPGASQPIGRKVILYLLWLYKPKAIYCGRGAGCNSVIQKISKLTDTLSVKWR